MKFSPSFMDEIRSRISISSVVGRAVQWDKRKTNASKGDYWACCPFHHEKTPSFHCEDRKGRYHCFGCKQSGDIFRFLVEKEGLSFPESVERLAREAGLELPKPDPQQAEREEQRERGLDATELAAKFFEQRLQSSEGAAARGYLADRGISERMQQAFRIGYAPAVRHGLKAHLAEAGVSADQMEAAGLVVTGDDIPVSFDRFRDRIIFPIRDLRGRVIAFGGRAMSADVPAKYLNSPEGPLFHKGRVLYNLDRARGPAHEAGKIIAVEGYMDVIAMERAGIANAVAPLGTALTEDQLALLWRVAPEPILCFDGDAAGIKAAYRALDLSMPLLVPGQSLRFALLPQDQDPDDLLRSQGAEAVRDVIARAEPLVDLLWRRALEENDRATPEARARLEVDIDRTVGGINDQKVRHHYRDELAGRLRALWGGKGSKGPGRDNRAARGAKPPGFKLRNGRFQRLAGWEVPAPASSALKALAGMGSRNEANERRERLIILAVLNHPALLDKDAEAFAESEFLSSALDSLRRQIIDSAALDSGLDTDTLRNHLLERGYGSLLKRIETQSERLNSWFLLPDAAPEDARTGFRHMLALHRKMVTLERELKRAEEALAEVPNEDNLARLNEIREEMRSTSGEEAAIEGFGEASGRATGVVA